MEEIVRPFQSIDLTATTRVSVVADAKVKIEPGHLCWGTAGTLPKAIEQADDFDGLNFRLEECDEHLQEDKRSTEKIRIENPDDPSQYVIYERIRKIGFKKTNKDKFIGVFHTDTTDFGTADVWAASSFGPVTQETKCGQQMYLNR